MDNPLIASETTAAGFWQYGGASARLRVFSPEDFRTADGLFVPRGAVSNRDSCFVEIAVTVNADLSLFIPSTDLIPFTTDSSRPHVRLSAYLYDSKDIQRNGFLLNFRVDPSLGPNTSWGLIDAFNRAKPRPLGDRYPNIETVTQMIAQQSDVSGPASTDGLGRVVLDTPAADPSRPEVVVSNSPLVALATTLAAGRAAASVPPADPLFPKFVGDNDARANFAYFAASYASLPAAVAAIGSAQATLVISSSYVLAANLTVPSNVTLHFTNAGKITVPSGFTLVHKGSIISGLSQIFAITGTGKVRLGSDVGSNWGSGRIPVVFPEWFGAHGDAVADDLLPLNYSIAALPVNGGTIIHLTGRYRITASLDIIYDNAHDNRAGVVIEGGNAGADGASLGTQLIYDGAAVAPIIRLHSRSCILRNFYMYVASGRTASCGIEVDQEPGGGAVTNNRFEFLRITNGYDLGTTGVLTDGVVIGPRTLVYNLDFNSFLKVYIIRAVESAIDIRSDTGQSKANVLTECVLQNSKWGIKQETGSFFVSGGTISGMSRAVLGLKATTDALTLLKVESESCPRLIEALGGSSAPWPVTIIGGRYSLDALHADGRYIDFQWGGPLTLQGVEFDSPYKANFRIFAGAGGSGAVIDARGNHFPNLTPFDTSNTVRIISEANKGLDSGGVYQMLDDFDLNYNGPTTAAGTAPFKTASKTVSVVTPFAAGDATPSVQSGNVFSTANVGATTVTNFDDGTNGQTITVKVDANTTIQHNATIKNRSGADIVGAADVTYTFTRIGGVWYQD